jgi:hypothetical protein
MGREIFRSYLPTPNLIQDGASLPTTPIQLSDGDWEGLRRLLESIRQVVNGTGGTITGKTFQTAVEPDQRVKISTASGIQIFNAKNQITATFDGDELTILGGTITGATFQTALSPNQRVEITTANGIRIYDNTNTLTAQFNGTTLTLIGGTITGGTITGSTIKTAVSPNARTEITTADGVRIYDSTNALVAQLASANAGGVSGSFLFASKASITTELRTNSIVSGSGAGNPITIDSLTGATLGGQADIKIDGSAAQGKVKFETQGVTRVTIDNTGLVINSGVVTGNLTGNVTGNVTGNLTGDSTGTHNGAVAGSGSIRGSFVEASSYLQSDTGDVYLGPSASSIYSMIKTNGGTTIKARKADNSGYASFEAGDITSSGLVSCSTITAGSTAFGGITGTFNPTLATSVTFVDGILFAFS